MKTFIVLFIIAASLPVEAACGKAPVEVEQRIEVLEGNSTEYRSTCGRGKRKLEGRKNSTLVKMISLCA